MHFRVVHSTGAAEDGSRLLALMIPLAAGCFALTLGCWTKWWLSAIMVVACVLMIAGCSLEYAYSGSINHETGFLVLIGLGFGLLMSAATIRRDAVAPSPRRGEFTTSKCLPLIPNED